MQYYYEDKTKRSVYMDYIIQTDSLIKNFGNKAAVDKVSLHVGKGEIYGLIGKNGAGKTTLMKLLLGLSSPNSGEMKLYGGSDLNKARRTIGSLIEEPALYKNETALENLRRFAILVPTPDEDLQKLLELVGNPDIMILDEPINGLDPAGIKEIRDIILELNKKGVTFLISSHLLDELGRIATKFGIMSDGVLTDEITKEELDARSRAFLKITVDDSQKAAQVLKAWNPTLKIDTEGNEVHITTEIEDTSEVVLALVNAGARVYEMRNESINLEDFFIERLG